MKQIYLNMKQTYLKMYYCQYCLGSDFFTPTGVNLVNPNNAPPVSEVF